MKKTWFQKSDNHLEDQLVDVGAATLKIITKIQVSKEKKIKFKKQCKKMVIGILINFQEHSPSKYSLIRNSLSLVLQTIVQQSEESCLRFRSGKLISCTHWTRSLLKWQTLQRINLINLSKQLVLRIKNRFFYVTLQRTTSIHSLAYI